MEIILDLVCGIASTLIAGGGTSIAAHNAGITIGIGQRTWRQKIDTGDVGRYASDGRGAGRIGAMVIVGGDISCIPHLCNIARKGSCDIDRGRFVGAHPDLDVRDVDIHIDVQNSTIIIHVGPKVSRRIAGNLGEQASRRAQQKRK